MIQEKYLKPQMPTRLELSTPESRTVYSPSSTDRIPSHLLHGPGAEAMEELNDDDRLWLFNEGMDILNRNEVDGNFYQIQPTPSKLAKLTQMSSSCIMKGSLTGSQDRPIVIFVPVVLNTGGGKRRGSMSSKQRCSSGSDSDTSGGSSNKSFEINAPQGLKTPSLNRLLQDYAEQCSQQSSVSMFTNNVEYSRLRAEACPKRVRKV
jgi:hypothetical protein